MENLKILHTKSSFNGSIVTNKWGFYIAMFEYWRRVVKKIRNIINDSKSWIVVTCCHLLSHTMRFQGWQTVSQNRTKWYWTHVVEGCWGWWLRSPIQIPYWFSLSFTHVSLLFKLFIPSSNLLAMRFLTTTFIQKRTCVQGFPQHFSAQGPRRSSSW